MRWIYLSPHLDDAVLSCGGWIWWQVQQGIKVEIWTICAGDPPAGPLSPYAQSLHERWQTGPEAVAMRRQEDQEACQLIGALPRYFPIPDCIYRHHPERGTPIVNKDEDLFQPSLPPSERPWVETLRTLIEAALSDADILVSPLALGGHIDHHLTRTAAEILAPSSLWYYADFPYALRERQTELRPTNTHRPYPLDLPPDAIDAWIKAITCYRSQLSTFWPDLPTLESEIHHYYQNCKDQILWMPSLPPR
ncbi:MAG: PIG-L family deacetylase [Thermanaerothrix sp.]|nr:PIG-L family deacetylase [Thermanaerothrix sp.]